MGGGGGHRRTPPARLACPVDAPTALKQSLPAWAAGHAFTGELRPALLSPKRPITNARVRTPDYAARPDGASESEQRDRRSNNNIRVYGPDELEGECNLRYATKMGREVLDEGGKALRVGVTTDEIDRVIHEASMERECYPSPLNYYNFPKSVCTSVNEVICHGIPDYREVQDG
jgi:methionyl aminopeptidase